MADRWSLGTLIGLPVAGLLTVVLLTGTVIGAFAWAHDRRARSYNRMPIAVPLGLLAALLAVVTVTAFTYWPFDAEYHRWHTTTGTVTTVSSRLLASDTKDGGTTQRFVVDLAGVGERSCDDTRCSMLKAGDVLTLSCKRAWQYAGTHGYDCAFVEVHR